MFGGGATFDDQTSTVDAYNASLTKSIPTGLSEARYAFDATTVGNYALFGGGYAYVNRTTSYDDVDVYQVS